MTVFWSKGYEGTSLSDLTEAMGISRPSMYAAYGNKQELFRKALERYGEGPSSYERAALAQPTARAVAEGLLRGAADVQTDPDTPAGCLAVLGTTYCAEDSSPVGKIVIAFDSPAMPRSASDSSAPVPRAICRRAPIPRI